MEQSRRWSHIRGGQALAAWRDASKLTQLQLANRIGLNPSTISAIECGERLPHTTEVCAKIQVVTEGAVRVEDWIDWTAINEEIIRRLPS